MVENKKYNVHVFQDGDAWSAQITRQVTSRKRTVSKQQDGFADEADAREWGQSELQKYVTAQQERNVKHATHRAELEQRQRDRADRRRAAYEARKAKSPESDA
ncbi:hypothetical protein GCM10008090_22440 [Arenicella chitinivorans]|uniref:DUF3622 domain-containing protein n=1 Tax=Arenicella chitinivorans TaxID=1329800 RepID=A0A918RVD9_9GAMM|nr:DUF3622 domain-containing protein [Arenicella chitinivorans]GHA12097.1 hypothetical protein GCM10008090_22440 [Arenicella chitinivorans]